MARWLGAYEFGVFVWVWTAALLIGSLACIGLSTAILRFIPEYKTAGDDPSLRGVIFGSRLYSFGIATVIAILATIAVYFFGDQMYQAHVMPLFLALVCVPMIALGDIHDGIARANDWMKLALSPTFLVRPVVILVLMAAALAAGFPHTASTAMGATVVAVWLVGFVQMLVLSRKLSKVVKSGPRNMQAGGWVKSALPSFLVEGFCNLLFHVDILMAGLLLSPDEVGVNFACVKVLALIHFVYFAVRTASAHRFSKYHSEGDKLRLDAFVHDTVRWTFWPSLAMALFLIIIGKPVLMLFGPGFADGYHLLFILAIGIVARASVGPGEALLSMSGHQNVCAALYGVTLVVAVTLNLIFIPLYGLTGAAIATASAMIFEAFALYSVVMRQLGLHLFVFFQPAKPSQEAR